MTGSLFTCVRRMWERLPNTGDEITVSFETLNRLEVIARHLNCNITAAVDEVVREFDPAKVRK